MHPKTRPRHLRKASEKIIHATRRKSTHRSRKASSCQPQPTMHLPNHLMSTPMFIHVCIYLSIDVSLVAPIIVSLAKFFQKASKNIVEVAKDPYKIEASINIWRQLYSKQILKFVDEKKYSSNFSRKILHDSYKTLNLLYEHMGNDLIANDMISYYEPTKKRYYRGKFLNSIIQNNQTIFW